MMLLVPGHRRDFDAQALAADQIQRTWQADGLDVARSRQADGTIRLEAAGKAAVVVLPNGTHSTAEASD